MFTLPQWIARLTKGYIKATGKEPDGLAKLKIKLEAAQRVRDQSKVVKGNFNPNEKWWEARKATPFSSPQTHKEKIDWLVKNVDPSAKQTIPPRETLEAMLKDGREDLIDHFFEMHTKELGKPKINIDTSGLKHPELVKKMMTDEKLKPTLVKTPKKTPPEDLASGGIARVGMMIGGFTKAQVLIQMLKNTIKGSKDPYVKKTFPNFIKELQKNPKLALDENVWKQFTTGLPKNQRLIVHSDDSVDFFRQTEFGPHNIEKTLEFQKKHNLSREQANIILKMEPEDRVLEMKRLETIADRSKTKHAYGGIAGQLHLYDGGRAGFKKGGFDPSKRRFLKGTGAALGVLSMIPFVGKFFKPVAKTVGKFKGTPNLVVDITKTPNMPDWYMPAIRKVLKQGEDITDTAATAERQTVHRDILPDGDQVTVTQNIDAQTIDVSVANPKDNYLSKTGAGESPYTIQYSKGQVIDSGKMKGQKTPDTLQVDEPYVRQAGPDTKDVEIEFDVMDYNPKNEVHDTSVLETYATGKKVKSRGTGEVRDPWEGYSPDLKADDYAKGGIAGQLHLNRPGYAGGTLVKGSRWLIKQLEKVLDNMTFGRGQFSKLPEARKVKLFKETEEIIKYLKGGGKIPDDIIKKIKTDPHFKRQDPKIRSRDPELAEMEDLVFGESKVVDETADLFNFKKILPEELRNSLNQLPDEGQIPLLKKFKQAFEATETGGIEAGVDVLQKELLAGFKPTGKPHAAGGRIGFSKGKGLSWLWKLLKEPKTSLYSREKANPLGPSLFETVAGDTSRRTFLKKLMLNDERMKRIKFKQMLKDATDEARRNPGYKFPSDKQVKEEIERIFAEAYSPHFTKHAAGGLAHVLGV